MARKLKTYRTSLGFFELAVAAPSMKAALEAWGMTNNAFQQGFASETDDARIIAATMAVPKSEEAIAQADRLPPGKLFASGSGMVPFCKVEALEKLVKALDLEPEAANPTASPTKPVAAAAKAPSGDPWAELKIGDKVIAQDGLEGWWPSVITGVSKDGQKLTLRWLVGDPKQKPVTVKRRTVALLSNG